MLASPEALVACNLIVVVPVFRLTIVCAVVQVVKSVVAGKLIADATVLPLINKLAGRSLPPPFEYRHEIVYVPAVGTEILQLMPLPVALVVLQKPAPVKPALLLSMVPSTLQNPVVLSWMVTVVPLLLLPGK